MSEHTVSDVLRMAGHLLADEKRWARGAFARDAAMLPVDLIDKQATCFCVAGAVRVCARALKVPQHVAVGEMRSVLKHQLVTIKWDRGTRADRLAIAAKLRSA